LYIEPVRGIDVAGYCTDTLPIPHHELRCVMEYDENTVASILNSFCPHILLPRHGNKFTAFYSETKRSSIHE